MLDLEAETLLQAWGALQRRHIADEVGLPSISPSCAGYEAPDWEPPPPPRETPDRVERACWAMLVLLSRQPRLHRDLREHYRDGARLSRERADEGRRVFGRIWHEWDGMTGPLNPI